MPTSDELAAALRRWLALDTGLDELPGPSDDHEQLVSDTEALLSAHQKSGDWRAEMGLSHQVCPHCGKLGTQITVGMANCDSCQRNFAIAEYATPEDQAGHQNLAAGNWEDRYRQSVREHEPELSDDQIEEGIESEELAHYGGKCDPYTCAICNDTPEDRPSRSWLEQHADVEDRAGSVSARSPEGCVGEGTPEDQAAPRQCALCRQTFPADETITVQPETWCLDCYKKVTPEHAAAIALRRIVESKPVIPDVANLTRQEREFYGAIDEGAAILRVTAAELGTCEACGQDLDEVSLACMHQDCERWGLPNTPEDHCPHGIPKPLCSACVPAPEQHKLSQIELRNFPATGMVDYDWEGESLVLTFTPEEQEGA